jgi:hypothetical protein
MNIAIVAALVLSVSAPAAYASSVCEAVSSLARSTMNARQAGVPMSEIYENGVEESQSVSQVRKSLILIAYEKPKFSTERYKTEAAEEFASDVFRRCVVARGE